ncbi:MAG: FAD-containing monooxygenase EthA [Proteobacteria bacterium]|nr:MAG: FAD-containing monooxygenase EthA [Pseudomonadota bacterium]
MAPTASDHFDVLIIGAGLSGIDAAWHLARYAPGKRFAILEGRDRIGGTWDLFRYPGIRSDSDMLTMGYSFRPWTQPKTISDGGDIRRYIEDTARESGLLDRIRFGHRVVRADWSSADARWTVETVRREASGREETVVFTAGFLCSCAGYYRYAEGYTPEFRGRERFAGTIVHPQQWPEDLDYAGKRVVVIGSGATAITLVPSMAKSAAHVTMLQRSPTWIVSRPERDPIAGALRAVLPAKPAFRISRWLNTLFQQWGYRASRRRPERMRRFLLDRVRAHLGPDYDVAKHFTPRYDPWDQRICLVPDADLFDAIREGRASVETDTIECFTETGIRLASGRELPADVIVTATGLVMELLGGVRVAVDGRPVDFAKALTYKGVMFSGVPNLVSVFGYINASWTLKADLVCRYLCRLLARMDETGAVQATPRVRAGDAAAAPFVEQFTPGYMQRSIDAWPKQGAGAPWRAHQSYFADLRALRFGPIEDGVLELAKRPPAAARKSDAEPAAA